MSDLEIIQNCFITHPQMIPVIETLETKIATQEQRIKELEMQLKQSSKTSSLPPSTDGFKRSKPVNLRVASKNKSGGQVGHVGSTLSQVQQPDQVIIHDIEVCQNCGTSLKNVEPISVIKRQVFETSEMKPTIIEHQAMSRVCAKCQIKNQAQFPEEVKQPVQYGIHFKSIMVYLNQHHLIPYRRLAHIAEDLFNQRPSEGSFFNFNKECYNLLAEVETSIKDELLKSAILHLDETGSYVLGSRWWLHVCSNTRLTYYHIHESRGKKAIDHIELLPLYTGVAVHDHYASYFTYKNCTHASCNVHILRDLRGVHELQGQTWASEMIKLFLEMKKYSEEVEYPLDPNVYKTFKQRYESLIDAGYQEDLKQNPMLPKIEDKKSKTNKSKARTLLNRLVKYQKENFMFLENKEVPFDNNLAERDVRMTKVKQKVSGCFRSEAGSKYYARINGYISTAKKQGINILEALKKVFMKDPYFLTIG